MSRILLSSLVGTGPVVVGGVLVLAAFLKALDPLEFKNHFNQLLELPPLLARICLSIFLALESALGTALILGLWPRWLLPSCFLLLAALTAWSQWGIASGRVEDCGCYGGPISLSARQSLALGVLWGLLLALPWLTGAHPETPPTRWRMGTLLVAGLVPFLLVEAAMLYQAKTGRPLLFRSAVREGRPWRSDWLGDPVRHALSCGEHLVVLLSVYCATCRKWVKAMNVVHLRPDLPDVVGAFALTESEISELRANAPFQFPLVSLKPVEMRKLTRHFPFGILVTDGTVREVWHKGMPESFVEKLRAGSPAQS